MFFLLMAAVVFAAPLGSAAGAARAALPDGAFTVAALGGNDLGAGSSVGEPDRMLVLRVQRHLRDLGLYEGGIDGIAGRVTGAAIRAYQRQSALPIDGVASRGLLEHLQSASSQAKRLLHRLKSARDDQIAAARRSLEDYGPARELLAAVNHRAPAGGKAAAQACYAAPSAACLLDVALGAAARVDKADFRDWALGDVAVAWARAGNRDAAVATAARMSDPRLLIAGLRRIARAQAEAGDFTGAHATATAIPDPRLRAEAFNAVAQAQFAAGHTRAAQETLVDVLVAAGVVAEPAREASLYSEIAGVQAKLGDASGAVASLDRALARAFAVDAPGERARALSKVAVSQAETGATATALSTVAAIDEARHRTPALILAAAAQAEAGDVARGLTTAATIGETRYRVVAFEKVARIQAKGGAGEAARLLLLRARKLGSDIEYAYARAFSLSRVARTQAELGDVKGALVTTGLVDNHALRARALWAVSRAQKAAGNAAGARRSAALADAASADVIDVLDRIWLLGDISVIRWRDGDKAGARQLFDRALATARGLSTHWMRARALSKLATALIARQGAASPR